VPDLDSPARALAAFYEGKEASVALGHVLIWISAGLFTAFGLRLHRAAATPQNAQGPLPAIVLASGITAAAALCLAFAFTGVTSF